jgi:peroxiredoxin
MVASDSETDALQRGETAPDFELQGTDGETYTLDDFADRDALLVVFTCNHCPYAKAKFDELNHIAQAYDAVGVVGINPNDAEQYPDDSFDRMQELVDDGTIQYDAYLRDESQAVAEAYGAACTPDPFLFENTAASETPRAAGEAGDDGGEFRLVYHGRLDDALNPDDEPSEREMRDIIDRLLAGETIDDEFKPSRGCSIKWTDD